MQFHRIAPSLTKSSLFLNSKIHSILLKKMNFFNWLSVRTEDKTQNKTEQKGNNLSASPVPSNMKSMVNYMRYSLLNDKNQRTPEYPSALFPHSAHK